MPLLEVDNQTRDSYTLATNSTTIVLDGLVWRGLVAVHPQDVNDEAELDRQWAANHDEILRLASENCQRVAGRPSL